MAIQITHNYIFTNLIIYMSSMDLQPTLNNSNQHEHIKLTSSSTQT